MGRPRPLPLLSTLLVCALAVSGALLWAAAIGTQAALAFAILLLGRCVVDAPKARIRPASSRTAVATAGALAVVALVDSYALDPLVLADSALAHLRAGLEWSLSFALFGVDFFSQLLEDWDVPSRRRRW